MQHVTSRQHCLRGVNFGGWLVLEEWITPTLFAGTGAIDEYTFVQTPGAAGQLRRHHHGFIQEEDFQWLHDNHIDAVRIPVGSWIFGDEPPYLGAIDRLDWAFQMAEKYQLKVLICLHGAPGSQNGLKHSGKSGSVKWHQHKRHQLKTTEALVRLARRYRDHHAFWGLELLNEPRPGLFQWTLRRFYKQTAQLLQTVLKPTTKIVFHDGFTPRLLSGVLGKNNPQLLMDVHWYHFSFLPFRFVPLSWYFMALSWYKRTFRRLGKTQGIIIGEWSSVLAGAVLKYIQPDTVHLSLMKEHVIHQLDVFEAVEAWFYWTYKTEHRGVWHFRSCVEDGFIELNNR